MSELKIEVSDEVKEANVLQEMCDELNKMTPPMLDKDTTFDNYYIDRSNFWGPSPETRLITRNVKVTRVRTVTEYETEKGWRELFGLASFQKRVEVKRPHTEPSYVWVGFINLKEKTITCSSKPDFDNLKALAVKFKFKKLVKNWPGAK